MDLSLTPSFRRRKLMTTNDQVVNNAALDMLNALKEAFAELGKDSRWKVSTLRLDIIRPAIAKADPELYESLYHPPRRFQRS
jgi:hypothetical protein